MEKKMINGHYHNPLDINNNFSTIESSQCSAASFYKPSKLMSLSTPRKPSSSPTVSFSPSVAGGGVNYVEHPISKFDTLAGLAIKYGVEVAEIKKLNGLVTDHQMFARKTLHIPSDGRHPPIVSDGPDNHGPNSSEQTSSKQSKSVSFESFKLGSSSVLNVSPAITTQLYSGLEPAIEKSHSEGLEMATYLKRGPHYPEDGPSASLSHHRKCKSVAYELYAKSIMDNNGGAEAPEMLLKEEVISGGGFSALGSKGSKGLALRNKSVSRTVSGGVDNEGGFPIALGNSAQAKVFGGVRRSSSTPSLQDAEIGTSSSSWWSLKPDLQALSTSSVTKPIFDGLPIPITGKKNKAAMD